MTIRTTTAEAVDRRLARLRERFDDFPVREETVENDLEFFEHGRMLAEEGWRGDAGAWVEADDDRVLFVRHADDPERWGIPGGGHEPGESHAETARREVLEETGVECEITGVWYARRREIALATDPDTRYWMLTVWFEARPVEGANAEDGLSVGDDEILEARWFADPPESVLDFLTPKVRQWANR